jgi:hypothetical protein
MKILVFTLLQVCTGAKSEQQSKLAARKVCTLFAGPILGGLHVA